MVQAAAEPSSQTGEFRSALDLHGQLRGGRRYLRTAGPAQEPPHPAEGLGKSWTPPKHLLLQTVNSGILIVAA